MFCIQVSIIVLFIFGNPPNNVAGWLVYIPPYIKSYLSDGRRHGLRNNNRCVSYETITVRAGGRGDDGERNLKWSEKRTGIESRDDEVTRVRVSGRRTKIDIVVNVKIIFLAHNRRWPINFLLLQNEGKKMAKSFVQSEI